MFVYAKKFISQHWVWEATSPTKLGRYKMKLYIPVQSYKGQVDFEQKQSMQTVLYNIFVITSAMILLMARIGMYAFYHFQVSTKLAMEWLFYCISVYLCRC